MPTRVTAVHVTQPTARRSIKKRPAAAAPKPVRSRPVDSFRLKFAPKGKRYKFRAGAAQSVHGVRLIVERRSAGLSTDQLLTRVGGWMKSVPRNLLANVDTVQVLRRHDGSLNQYVNELQGSSGGIVQGLTRGTEITLFGTAGATFETFAHELAHTVEVDLDAWHRAAKADNRVVQLLDGNGFLRVHRFGKEFGTSDMPRLSTGAITPYGKTNRLEDIAESMRLLLSERHYGHAFASYSPLDNGIRRGTRALSFTALYPHRTALLERSTKSDLNGNGRIGA